MLGYVAVLGVGYVLGTKAGRRRYEQIVVAYKAVSEIGLRYGYNLSPKDRPQNIQPIWFEETFSELLGVIS